MNRPFAESFLNREKHIVLRQRLLPLSLWHLLHLEIVNSPFFVGGSFPGVKDLRIAVAICQTSFPYLPNLDGKKVFLDWVKTWGCGFFSESVKFKTYLEDFNALPQLWKKSEEKSSGNRKQVGLPWQLAIVTSICGSTGWSAETAWNLPIGQAYWYHVGFAIQRGCDIDLLSEGEMLAAERVRNKRLAKGA